MRYLEYKLKTFEKYYDLAIAHLQPSLIVIHGVGSGRLRDEIHELLKLRKEVKTFVNQYDPQFWLWCYRNISFNTEYTFYFCYSL